MLVLNRFPGESIIIAERWKILVRHARHGLATLHIRDMHSSSSLPIELTVSDHPGDSIVIAGNVRIQIVTTIGGSARMGFDAPRHIAIRREEIPVGGGFKKVGAA